MPVAQFSNGNSSDEDNIINTVNKDSIRMKFFEVSTLKIYF